jgi:hypothetical protein
MGTSMLGSVAGKSTSMRLLSKSRPDAVFARAMLLSMLLLLIMFLVYKLVTIVTTDETKLLRGKLVILSLALILGTVAGMLARPLVTTLNKPLDYIID